MISEPGVTPGLPFGPLGVAQKPKLKGRKLEKGCPIPSCLYFFLGGWWHTRLTPPGSVLGYHSWRAQGTLLGTRVSNPSCLCARQVSFLLSYRSAPSFPLLVFKHTAPTPSWNMIFQLRKERETTPEGPPNVAHMWLLRTEGRTVLRKSCLQVRPCHEDVGEGCRAGWMAWSKLHSL